jgi:beta-glucosidase
MWTCQDWIRASNEFQAAVKTLKGVPPFLGMDSIHGAAFIHGATVFPQPIGQAATWNTSMIHEVNIITAKDMRTCGLNWAFAPSADIGMQPLWGRHWETFGDEPALVSAMVRASITGLQRTDLATEDFQYNTPSTNYTMILACIKHWIGYSLPDNGVDRQMATVRN